MKHFLFLMLVLLSVPLHAQLEYVVSAGINYSTAVTVRNIAVNFDHRANFFLGAGIRKPMAAKWTFHANLQFSNKGYAQDDVYSLQEMPLAGRSKYLLSYIDLIPEIRYRIVKGLNIGMGLNIARKINERHTFTADTPVGGFELKRKTYFHEDYDFGGVVTLCMDMEKVAVFVRYNQGLSSLRLFKWVDENGTEHTYGLDNENFQFGVAYLL